MGTIRLDYLLLASIEPKNKPGGRMLGGITGSTFVGAIPTIGLPASPPVTTTTFGPDYLLQTLAASQAAASTTYDASGRIVDPAAESPAAKLRQKTLKQIAHFLKLRDTASARTAAEALMKKNSGDSLASAYIGRSYLMDGDYKKAEQFLARAAVSNPNDQIQLDLRNSRILAQGEAKATDTMKRLLAQPASSRQALQLATFLIDQHPTNLDARMALVRFYEKHGQHNLAGSELHEAIDSAPASRRPELIEYIKGFVARHENDKAAHDLLGQAFAADGNIDAADIEFQRALSLSAGDLEFERQLKSDQAEIFDQRAEAAKTAGRIDNARDALKRALSLSPNDERRTRLSDLEYKSGIDAMQRGNLNFALRAFDAARTALPLRNNEELKNELNVAYQNLAARFESAADLKNVALARQGSYELKPSDETRKTSLANAHDTYGLDLHVRQDYSNAVLAFRKALKLYPNNAAYAQHLAAALSHL